MRVIYYKKNAESDFHIPADSYASYFFIPDEKTVIFSEQHGSFGSVTYSLTDREEILREAQLIADGKIPDIEMVSFSDISDFDYDDGIIKGLIEDTKSAKEIDERTKAGIEQLFETAMGNDIEKEKEYPKINPTTLDQATLGRLEGLVAKIDNDHLKNSYYGKLKRTKGVPEERGEQALEEFRQVVKHADPSWLLYKFRGIEEQAYGIFSDSFRSVLLEMFYRIAQKGRKYDLMREVGYELERDENKVEAEITLRRNEKLQEVMFELWGLRIEEREGMHYLPAVRRAAKDIPDERVYETAKITYEILFFTGGTQHLIKAALLAKEYLGDKEFLTAGRILVQSTLDHRFDGNLNNKYFRVVDSLELPEKIAHPLMLYFFNASLGDHSMDPVAIAKKHNLTDDEIRGAVNESYGTFFQQGNVQGALNVRKLFDDFVEDKSIPLEDLQTLVGVMNYRLK